MSICEKIPVIDLFAGPGGLGEGFSAYGGKDPKFKIRFSVEMEDNAHQTLELRSFFRQFPRGKAPAEYYSYVRGEIDRKALFDAHPEQAENAKNEALHAELGKTDPDIIDGYISNALGNASSWVLIGGPPCQAYSLAGRSRNKGKKDYKPEEDNRHFLYKEYLRIIAEHCPPVFVMENVKGILSAQVNGESIFARIKQDLKAPYRVVPKADTSKCYHYNLYSFVKTCNGKLFDDSFWEPKDYVIRSECYGVPQARHRVIILGIREDYNSITNHTLTESEAPGVRSVIGDLPKVRSGLSNSDSAELWKNALKNVLKSSWLEGLEDSVRIEITKTINQIRLPQKKRGAEFIAYSGKIRAMQRWFHDRKLCGVCNHVTRGHILEDVYRYLFASCFAKVKGVSPILGDFPKALRPNHRNVQQAITEGSLFSDRFRVQITDKPATTITSHISKDGHYYIHYDPSQCRSLTVREAARLQTFPDNYFFCGPRTAQYHQVGNAVPPYLAHQIAGVVWKILEKHA